MPLAKRPLSLAPIDNRAARVSKPDCLVYLTGFIRTVAPMQDNAMSVDRDGPDDPTPLRAGLSEILTPGLSVVFCGLNPALSAVRDGHNF